MIGCCEFTFLIDVFIKVIHTNWGHLAGLTELLLGLTMKNIKTLPTPKHNTHLFLLIRQTSWKRDWKAIEKNKNRVGKPGLWLKTVIRKGVNGRKLIEETFAAKIKSWRQNKMMNGFIIYKEKWRYLQSSSLYLIQRESPEYRSHDTV